MVDKKVPTTGAKWNKGIYLCLLNAVNETREMRRTAKDMYMVVDLKGKSMNDDLEECLKITCSNKRALSVVSGVRYYRLVYVFKRQKKTFLVENDKLILRSNLLYKGSQPGGYRKKEVRGNIDY